MLVQLLLHIESPETRGDIGMWLFFGIPLLAVAIGIPLIYRAWRWH
jgi:hypothetical protein